MKNAAKSVSLIDSLSDSSNIWQESDKMSLWGNYETSDTIFGITLFSVYFNLEYFTLDKRSDIWSEQ